MAVLSYLVFLVCDWSGICWSPRTRQWSFSQRRQAGSRERTMGQTAKWRRWVGTSLASKSQLWGIKIGFSQWTLSLDLLGFIDFIGNLLPAGKTLPPRATVFLCPSLELAFLIFALCPKITRASEMQKEKNKPFPDKKIEEFGNTQLEKKTNH